MILGTRTKYGQVEGVATETKGVALFRGIPYARPPVGKYRWREPEPPDAWEGVRKCEFYGPACIQPEREKEDFYRKEFYQHRFHRYPPLWGEDCLYLNIWTPAETRDDGLPVMIWIHGGGYRQGYSHEPRTNGEAMARSGIVVVSVNYRLNIFGFFAHPALSKEQKGHSGNYGILDQAAALKWVRENIREFGGDPDNITVAGQSAGSFSAQAMAVIPQTRGMIRRVILQSGVITPTEEYGWLYRTQREAEENGMHFMEYAKKRSLPELRAMTAEELMRIYLDYTSKGNPDFNSCCQDGYVFDKSPGHSFMAGQTHIEAMIAGATSRETMIMPRISGVTKENYRQMAETYLPGCEFDLLAKTEVADDKEADSRLNSWFAWYMNGGSLALCEYMASSPGKKAYSYSFCRDVPGKDNPGPFHSACIWYAFGNLHNCKRPFKEEDFYLEQVMNQYWIQFIKTGDPNRDGLPLWKEYTPKEPMSMMLDGENFLMRQLTKRDPELMLLFTCGCSNRLMPL